MTSSMPKVRSHDQSGTRGQILKGLCTLCGAGDGSEACWDGESYYDGCPVLTNEELAAAERIPDEGAA